MGCMQVRIEPNRSANSIKAKTTNSQVECSRNRPSKFERSSMTFSTTIRSTPVTMMDSLIMSRSGISIKSGDLTQPSTTLVQSFNTNVGINRTVSEFDASISQQNASIDLKETATTRSNIPGVVEMDSNASEIPEVSSMSITTSELDQLSSIHSSELSPSFDLAHQKQRRTAVHEVLPARPKRSKHQRTPARENLWSKSEESYSLRDSFVTSISADSERSASDRAKDIRPPLPRPKKSRVRRKTLVNQPHGESDESILHRVTRKNDLNLPLPSVRSSNPDDHPTISLAKTIE